MPHRRSNSSILSTLLLSAPILLSACAVAPGMTPQEESLRNEIAVDRFMPATREMRDNIETQELFAQAAFWSHEYELNPTDLEATIKLASAVRRLGNPGRAVEITQTSRAIHPRDPYLLAEHAAGLIADQRALDAVPVLEDGLRVAPAYGRLWSLKGAALDQMENYDAARQHYQRALQITPNDPNVLTNLGLSYALSGDLAQSETWLRRAASIPGASQGVHQNLTMVLQLQGKTEDAERQMRLSQLTRGDRKLPPAPVPAFQARGTSPQNTMAGSYNPSQANPVTGARLTTTTQDGQPFRSASDAARAAAHARQSGSTASTQEVYRGGPMSAEQSQVLSRIQQSMQGGQATPQTGQTTQPHLVGPVLQSTPSYSANRPAQPQQTWGDPSMAAPQTDTRRTPARRRR